MVFYLDDRSMMDEVGLPGLESMLRAYPDSDFVMHSHGWLSHMTADVEPFDLERGAFPDGPVEEPGRCDELLATYDNLYADISASSGWNAFTRDEEYAREFLERHYQSILFATDRLGDWDPPTTQFFDRFDLSAAATEAIAYENVLGLLR